MSIRTRSTLLFCALSALAAGGCATKIAASFSNGRPVFEPEKYFAHATRSWGILETGSGKPAEILHTKTSGHVIRDGLAFEQDLDFEHSKRSHRSWRLWRIDAHHYSATGTGIVGTARGEAYGNVFHLDFTLDAFPGNPLGHLHMSQWMYLQSDGVTMVNSDTLTKAGIVVARITEQFKRADR